MSLQKQSISPARSISIDLLNKILKSNAPFEHVISKSIQFINMDTKDRKFCRLLITVVLRKLGQIDHVLGRFLKRGIPQKENTFNNIMRIGVAELLFIESAKYAAIDDAVEITKLKVSKNLSKLANAVLRNIDRDNKNILSQLTNEMNYPKWLVKNWEASWGKNKTKDILKWLQTQPYLDLTVSGNPIEMEAVIDGKFIWGKTVRKKSLVNPTSIPYFHSQIKKYRWWVQDVSASIPGELLINSDKMNIIDLCSAPGGKTAQLASSGKKVISVDINQKRVEYLKENMKRLDLQTNIVISDGTLWKPKCDIDAVLLDAPCSATGTIRRHPDILKNRTKENLYCYLEIQSKLIKQSLSWLNKNGILIYSVCSLQKEEGENQIYSILKKSQDLKILRILPKEVSKFEHAITKEGWLRIFPNCLGSDGGNDGFFICRLQKI